jgi:hypothetical protein
MRRFPVHIKNIDGTQTACTTFQLWSGLTTNIAEAHICPPYSAITRADLTNPTGFTADIYYNEPSLIDEIYIFLVHCDGFILPSSGVPCCGDTQPKRQGGYQIRAVKLFCPTPTPTPTPTRAVICTFEGGVATIVTGALPGPTPTSTPPAPTPTHTPPAPTPTHTPPTPTLTTSGSATSGCATMTTSTRNEQINCLGQGPYNNEITTVTATLAIASSVDVTIRANCTRTLCYGQMQSDYFDILINAGQTSKSIDITTIGYVDCGGQDPSCTVESISIDTYTSRTNNYTICQTTPPPPTPTSSTPSSSGGQCYTYTLDNVSDTDYGVSYVPVGGTTTIVQFGSLPSQQVSNGVYSYSICTEVEPTLLDTSSWPSVRGIGSSDRITRTGPNGTCYNNFDCYIN